ncbi:hypothetical protein FB451DRAFT_1263722 [Mycena latifolia]|nr:hypothetical protein FB451DRAFT_1263722 [Mycena latifolia]
MTGYGQTGSMGFQTQPHRLRRQSGTFDRRAFKIFSVRTSRRSLRSKERPQAHNTCQNLGLLSSSSTESPPTHTQLSTPAFPNSPTMSLDAQPLLAIVEEGHAHGDAGGAEAQHFCARCSSELGAHEDYKASKIWTLRHILIVVAFVLSSLLFFFAVLVLGLGVLSQIFVVIWTIMTITALALLLYMGRRKSDGKLACLGCTSVQIRVLCTLGVSWILFIFAMVYWNKRACYVGPEACGLFTTINVLMWFLMIALFCAAYATYRRAIAIHGTTMVPVPTSTMVQAWCISDIADSEGAIKI